MDVLFSILGSVATEACCLFCCSIDCCICNTVQFKSNRKALEEETEALVELKDKVAREVEASERDGKSAKTRVKEWLGEVEKLLGEVKSLETRIKDYKRRRNQRCKFSKEVSMMLKKVRRLTCVGSFFNTGTVDHGPGTSTEFQATA